jgi:hypothetical protein
MQPLMANGGWYGTPEEWQRLEAPLLQVDSCIERFAREHSLNLSKNHKEWPERSLTWGENPRCLIQLYLAEEEDLTWNLWLCCSEDRGGERFWRKEFAVRGQKLEQFIMDLPKLLDESLKQLNDWRAAPDKLEFATKLQPLPKH